MMSTFSELKKKLKNIPQGLIPIKIAILGDTATQFLAKSLQGAAIDSGYNLILFEADFGQISQQILDPTSTYYEFNADVTLIFESSHKLLAKYYKSKENPSFFAKNKIEEIKLLVESIKRQNQSKIIYCNFPTIDNQVFGNFSSKVEASFPFQLTKLNYLLNEYATVEPQIFIEDLQSIQSKYGRDTVFSSNIYVNTEMVLSLDLLPKVAYSIMGIVSSFYGKFKKCIILDLDNTTWGGIIGDDGLEKIQIGSLGIGKAFTELQYWVKALQKRGIIVAVCSKNDEDKAKEPFEKHPDMILRLEDIAVFVANWENKADNIRKIQKILNIGFDSMVFLDDNPFERNLVRENLPEICVPELPEDPAEYLEYLYSLNLFETTSFSENDAERTKQYQVEAQRTIALESFTNLDDYLGSLEMVSEVKPFDSFSITRVSQLTQRSNQFNLRTQRYTEAEIQNIADSEDYITLSFTLKDKYGDNGLISVIILKNKNTEELFIDTWLMSCRVLKRGMEQFVLNTLVETAKSKDYKYLIGEYLPTPKNLMVENHYQNLGFEEKNSLWYLDLENYNFKNTFINKNI